MTGYYDIVLGLIPFGLGGIASVLMLFGFQLTVAVPVASLFAIGLIAHAMFVRTPTDAVAGAATAANADGPAFRSAD